MSRPDEFYAILRDGYPLGVSARNRFMRTYKTEYSAERSARDMKDDDTRLGRGERIYEVVRVSFDKVTKEGAN